MKKGKVILAAVLAVAVVGWTAVVACFGLESRASSVTAAFLGEGEAQMSEVTTVSHPAVTVTYTGNSIEAVGDIGYGAMVRLHLPIPDGVVQDPVDCTGKFRVTGVAQSQNKTRIVLTHRITNRRVYLDCKDLLPSSDMIQDFGETMELQNT